MLQPKRVVGLIFLFGCLIAAGQRVDRHKLIVAYVNAFIKNIVWSSEKEVYKILVISEDDELNEEFRRLAKSKKVRGKAIEVYFSNYPAITDQVDVVYLSAKFNASLVSVKDQIGNNETLLVTDSEEDERLIMINFTVSEGGPLNFEINRANIINQGMRILPEMLLLVGSEIDVARLYREAQDSVRFMEDRIAMLQANYDSIANKVALTERIIQNQNIKIDEQLDEIYEKQSTINWQSRSLDSLRMEYRNSETSLDSIQKNLQVRENQLLRLQSAIDKQSDQLEEGNETLEQQLLLISEQDREIKSRESRLEEMTVIVDAQQNTLIYLALFLIAVLVIAVLIYRAYSDRKRDAKLLMEQKEELSTLITELHQTQTQLVQSEKMASLGVLTAGIAHEINNAINFVYSGIQILEMKFSDIKPVLNEFRALNIDDLDFKGRIKNLVEEKEKMAYDESQDLIDQMIQNIQIGVGRTTEIIKGLRTFSRSEDEEKTNVNIHKDIEVALLLLKSRYKDVIQINKKFDNKIPEIAGYQGQLGQAFLNIINNAIDAVAGRGDKAEITIETKLKNEMIEISIMDNGMGIPREISDRIFDPFFTTKKVGAGTGLGLSITYGIVEKHGGTIGVHSKKYGTEFLITLPLGVV